MHKTKVVDKASKRRYKEKASPYKGGSYKEAKKALKECELRSNYLHTKFLKCEVHANKTIT